MKLYFHLNPLTQHLLLSSILKTQSSEQGIGNKFAVYTVIGVVRFLGSETGVLIGCQSNQALCVLTLFSGGLAEQDPYIIMPFHTENRPKDGSLTSLGISKSYLLTATHF